MYLTYSEYQTYGGQLGQTAFEMYEFEASAQVDFYTFNRLKKDGGFTEQSEEVQTAVKRCVYRLVKLLQARDTILATSGDDGTGDNVSVAGITSQSNDGVSVSYNVLSASEASSKVDTDIERTISTYLTACKNSLGQRLLYRGIYPDE